MASSKLRFYSKYLAHRILLSDECGIIKCLLSDRYLMYKKSTFKYELVDKFVVEIPYDCNSPA
jgi:hypothetical protein